MRCGGPQSRRSFLEAGALSVPGLGWSDFLQLCAIGKDASKLDEALAKVKTLPG